MIQVKQLHNRKNNITTGETTNEIRQNTMNDFQILHNYQVLRNLDKKVALITTSVKKLVYIKLNNKKCKISKWKVL